MKRYYEISRLIIGVLAVILSLIAFINEDISVKIAGTVFVFSVALAISFIASPISKRMLKAGDGIANKYLRILYYVSILPLTLLAAFVLYVLIMFAYEQSSHTINAAAITIFSYVGTTIMVIVPYIQTLIVLMVRRILKDNTDEQCISE